MEPLNGLLLAEDFKSIYQKGQQELYSIESSVYDNFLKNQCPELMNIIKRDEIQEFVKFKSQNNLENSVSAILVLTFLHKSLKIAKFLYQLGMKLTFDKLEIYRFLIYNQNVDYIKWYYGLAKSDIDSILSDHMFISISGFSFNQKINQYLVEQGLIKKEQYSHLFLSYGQSGNLDASKWLLDRIEDKEDKEDAKLIIYYAAIPKNKKNTLKWVVENYQGDPIDLIRLNNYHERIFNDSTNLIRYNGVGYFGLNNLIKYGHLEILQLLDLKLNLTNDIQYFAILFVESFVFKNLDVIKWVIQTSNLDECETIYLEQAISIEWYQCAEFIWNHCENITLPNINKYFQMVLIDGNIDFAQKLLNSKQKDDIHVTDIDYMTAISSDKVEVVKWFLEKFPAFDTENMHHTGIPATMEITEYLINKIPNYKVSEDSFITTCYYSDTRILKYLMTYPLDFDIEQCIDTILCEIVENKRFDNAKHLIENVDSIDLRMENDILYILACDKSIEFVKYLLSKCPEMSNVENANRALIEHCHNINLDMINIRWLVNEQGADLRYRNDDPLLFGTLQNKPQLVSYIMTKHPDANFRDGDDKLFKYACRNNYVYVAQIFDEICTDYYLEVDGNEITSWYIKDFYTNQLDLIENDYQQILDNLKIKTEIISGTDDTTCIVCHEEHDTILKLPCKHCVCLYSLLKNYQVVKKFDGCFYCRDKYELNQCINMVKCNEEKINEKENSRKRKRDDDNSEMYIPIKKNK